MIIAMPTVAHRGQGNAGALQEDAATHAICRYAAAACPRHMPNRVYAVNVKVRMRAFTFRHIRLPLQRESIRFATRHVEENTSV